MIRKVSLSAAMTVASLTLTCTSAEFFAREGFIYDEAGRVRLFHGENFVQKGEPWYPEVLLTEDNIAEMQSWGWNTARLGVMWSGVEPELGVFNETYIEVIDGILTTLEAYGIHALIDVHQDVLSSYFCEYDGAPKWLVDLSTSCREDHEFPWPLQGECADRQWGANYLSEACGAAFQDLYDNSAGMRDHFLRFWAKLASSFKSHALLGYEIINEPWAGNIFAQPSLLLPGVAGSTNLQSFYDAVSEGIRAEDPATLVFYEPVTWGMIFNGTVSGSGFDHVPGGAQHAEKSVFSFHYYCWWYSSDEDAFQRRTCDQRFGPRVFDQVDEDVRKLGGAAMLTEWGQGCEFYGDDTSKTGECAPIMDTADAHLTSWIDWYWTGSLMNGWQTSEEAVATYSRTYAQAVAGAPSRMQFQAGSQNKRFLLCYTPSRALDVQGQELPTVIYVNNKVHYPSGLRAFVTGAAAAQMTVRIGDPETNQVLIYYTPSSGAGAQQEEREVCVHVEAILHSER